MKYVLDIIVLSIFGFGIPGYGIWQSIKKPEPLPEVRVDMSEAVVVWEGRI